MKYIYFTLMCFMVVYSFIFIANLILLGFLQIYDRNPTFFWVEFGFVVVCSVVMTINAKRKGMI